MNPPTEDDSPSVSPRINNGEFQNPVHSVMLLEGLQELYQRRLFTDVTLVIADHKFECHRNVLSACSPYFKAMFTTDLMESRNDEIVICNVNPQAVESVVNYIYTSKLNITEENVQAVLSAAHLFQMQAVIDACCKVMENHLHASNCIGVYHFADMYSCIALKNTANRFLNENFMQVCEQEEFLQLSSDELLEVISREQLSVTSEEDIFEAAMNWINYDPDGRRTHLHPVLSSIRLGLIDMKYVQNVIGNNALIASDDKCHNIMKDVKEFYQMSENARRDSRLNAIPRAGMWTDEMIVCIGLDINESGHTHVQYHDPRTNRWHQIQSLPYPLGLPACTSTCDNTIYVAGGVLYPWEDCTDLCYSYDHRQNRWIQRSAMQNPRSYFSLVSVDGLVYAIGGLNTLQEDRYSVVSIVECFSPRKNEWRTVSSIPEPVFGHATVVHKGLIYVIGGVRTGTLISKKVQCYDPAKNTWKELPPMKNARALCSATVRGDTIFVVGGLDRVSRWNTILSPAMCLSSYEIYNIRDNEWSEHQHVSGAGLFFPLVVTANDRTFAFQNGLGADSNDVMLLWDEDSKAWIYHDSILPTEDCRYGVTVSRFLKRKKASPLKLSPNNH
ncbi:kelch-like protein 20 [Ptychodera flava]|uniref:kelch-like protein 20 n=1 Tax=Ptychodera flava TaxID=63121 RepID=UPI00396A0C56